MTAWGKHTPAFYKVQHATRQAVDINKNDILPVVTVRNPWRWMQSMCKNPYSAKWQHYSICPNLKDSKNEWNGVSVKYGAGSENYTSLVHLWLDWYRQYIVDADFPVIVVRMEDLIFFTKDTVSQICSCAGGQLYDANNFTYVVDSAKADSPGHDTSTGLATAWIKYSQPLQVHAGFVETDYHAAYRELSKDENHLMQLLGYQHPPAS
jgi:hypothetical protein